MPRESDNSAPVETDNAHPLSLDDAANLDWFDPGADTGPEDEELQSDDETVETDDEQDGQETDEATADDDASDEEGQPDDESDPDADGEDEAEAEQVAAEVKDDQVITLPNGESLPFGELKSGYLRQSDYSRKTQELSNKRRDLDALATNVNASVDALAGLLEKSLPPLPDQSLAFKDPQRHYAMKTARENAERRLQEVLEAAHAPKEATSTLTQADHDELVRNETVKLAEAFPQVRTPEGHKKFFDEASAIARELGYSDDEIGQATDHRLFKMAHYARLGMQAEAAQKKAKDKVRNAPPVAPTKRQQGPKVTKARKNAEGMRKLQKTGSIHDAMSIDFD